MKQKSKPKNYLHLTKKYSNLIVINDSDEKNKTSNTNTSNNINSSKLNEITKPKSKSKNKNKNKNKRKKIKYDPFVFRMIQERNKKKWKVNIVYCVANYMTFEECLLLRLVCKLFNDGIKNKYNFLNTDMLFSSDEKIYEKIRNEYNITNKNKKDKIILKELFGDNCEEAKDKKDNYYKIYKDFEFNKREVSNYSKKNMLSDMIYNKYYMSIKYKTKKGELILPKNFII